MEEEKRMFFKGDYNRPMEILKSPSLSPVLIIIYLYPRPFIIAFVHLRAVLIFIFDYSVCHSYKESFFSHKISLLICRLGSQQAVSVSFLKGMGGKDLNPLTMSE